MIETLLRQLNNDELKDIFNEYSSDEILLPHTLVIVKQISEYYNSSNFTSLSKIIWLETAKILLDRYNIT